MEKSISCYYCGSTKVVRNGRTYYGKARGKCKSCYKQFVLERKNKSLTGEEKKRIELLLLERISLEGICRVLEVSAYHVYKYMEELYQEIPADLHAQVATTAPIDLQVLECESDELWSFVQKKVNKQWVWVAQDRESRQILAIHVGNRGETGARGLWQAIPETYRQNATFYTDDWEPYKKVIPKEKHHYSKTKKDTNHIERFFCTLRQRASRLVRLALSFSKRLDRHINAIRFFAANHNLSLLYSLLGLLFLTFACEPCGSKDYNVISDNHISFDLFYKNTQRSVIGLFPDTSVVRLLDQEGKQPFLSEVDEVGRVSLYYLDRGVYKQTKHTPFRKQFFLHLSRTDSDTITVEYELDSDKCNATVVKSPSFRVFYNDSLQFSGQAGSLYLKLYK